MERFPPFHERYPASLRAWVDARPWRAFREIQKAAIAAIDIEPTSPLADIILESETSSGKTEAIFLPLLARALLRPERAGFSIIYVSPLKALINDAYERLQEVARAIDLPLYRWHSDNQTDKTAARKNLTGILLTTPESIEGFLVRAATFPAQLAALASADAIIVDELHAYFGTARGRHLQSLLHRLDLTAGRAIPRMGLSATLGEISAEAAAVLRPKAKVAATVLRSTGAEARPAQVGVKVFLEDAAEDQALGEARKAMTDRCAQEIISDMSGDARGLVFANARAVVETLYPRINELKGDAQFVAARHHSSVPKTERESAETKMRSKYDATDNPERMVVVCTNTLELGIDIGSVQRVVQIDPTYSVAALRQRVGRSGRRDTTAHGMIYVAERELDSGAHPLEKLRLRTVQALATAQLSLEGAYEAPNLHELHLSTLYHQVLSYLLQRRTPVLTAVLHQALVVGGPWESDGFLGEPRVFARFLESLTEIKRPQIGLGEAGWSLVEEHPERRHAYAVFTTPAEYVVQHATTVIGRLPVTVPYRTGDTFVLGGGRWRVTHVNERNIYVARAPSASAPRFGGSAQAPSGLVTKRMREILEGHPIPGLALNPAVDNMVAEARDAYQALGLATRRILTFDRETIVFPWTGAKLTETLVLALRREGRRAAASGPAIVVEEPSAEGVRETLAGLRGVVPDLEELAREARQPQQDKYDRLLLPYYLRLSYARRNLTGEGFPELIADLLAESQAIAA